MTDRIDRSWNRRSGWCTQHGRPACEGCKWDGCECPEPVCVAKRAKQSGNERVSAAVEWDNRDAPAGCVNTAARADHLPGTSRKGLR